MFYLRVISVLIVGRSPVSVLLEVVAGHDPGEAVVLGQGEAHSVDVFGRVLVGDHSTCGERKGISPKQMIPEWYSQL